VNKIGDNVADGDVLHPVLVESAVIATPDLERRVLPPGFERSTETAKRLQDQGNATIAHCKDRRSIVFVDALPKNATGKI